MSSLQTASFRGVLAHCLSNWGNPTPWAVLADTIRDQGCDEAVALEAEHPFHVIRPRDVVRFIDIDIGIGYGSGYGIGSGVGIGYGIGYGDGSGNGIGRGRGSGRSSQNTNIQFGISIMELGKAYLFFCGDWHAFVGRVVGQAGPFTYQLEAASKVRDTNSGDNWHALAAGDESARRDAEYAHYTTPVFVPLTIAAVEWVGETPQEFSR